MEMRFQYTNPIVFAFWKDDELLGFRADTFGTISMTQPKVYNYSPQQVETVMDNIKGSLNMRDSAAMKRIEEMGYVDEVLAISDFVLNSERTMRAWNQFEVRVHPFIEPIEDEVLMKIAIENLKAPIEIRKFTISNNEN
jgi:hypothetical protein